MRSILGISLIRSLFSRWIRSQVDKESTVTDTATLFKVLLKESGCFHVDTHGGENDGEIVLVSVMNTFSSTGSANQTSLSTDLSSNLLSAHTNSLCVHLIVGQTYGLVSFLSNEQNVPAALKMGIF
jgi:hypothetical protein